MPVFDLARDIRIPKYFDWGRFEYVIRRGLSPLEHAGGRSRWLPAGGRLKAARELFRGMLKCVAIVDNASSIPSESFPEYQDPNSTDKRNDAKLRPRRLE